MRPHYAVFWQTELGSSRVLYLSDLIGWHLEQFVARFIAESALDIAEQICRGILLQGEGIVWDIVHVVTVRLARQTTADVVLDTLQRSER